MNTLKYLKAQNKALSFLFLITLGFATACNSVINPPVKNLRLTASPLAQPAASNVILISTTSTPGTQAPISFTPIMGLEQTKTITIMPAELSLTLTTPIERTSTAEIASFEKIDAANIKGLHTIIEKDTKFTAGGIFWFSGSKIIGVYDFRTVELYETSTLTKGSSIKMPPGAFFFLPVYGESFLLSWIVEKTVYIVTPDTGKVVHTYAWEGDFLNAIGFDSTGKKMAWSGEKSSNEVKYNVTEIIDIDQGKTLQTFQGYQNRVCSLAFSPTGELLVISTCGRKVSNNQILVWQTASGNLLGTIPGNFFDGAIVKFSHQSDFIAVMEDGVQIWDIKEQAGGAKYESIGEYGGHIKLGEFSFDDQLFLAVDDSKEMAVWDVSTGKKLIDKRNLGELVFGASFSPDGKLLATINPDGLIKLWAVK